jgi:5-oxoprolinase (ATP-hydrolysing)
MLGRLIPDFFPKIFGKNENEALDVQGTELAFEKLTKDINQSLLEIEGSTPLTVDEVAYGFLRVANESMCRPIRALTQAKGHDTRNHILASFGGAVRFSLVVFHLLSLTF